MKVIITGSTGMVGKSVLLECIENVNVKKILLVNRKPLNIEHTKIKEILHEDFSDISAIMDQLKGYDACFYCMGVSAGGMNREKYFRITYSMTEAFVNTLYMLNPKMVFNYVSGLGTDGSEAGKIRWARVKGKTENLVINKGFRDAYAFRPGMILPAKGVRSRTPWYNALYFLARPLFPLLEKQHSITTGPKLGKAMIYSVLNSQETKVLDNPEINKMANNLN